MIRSVFRNTNKFNIKFMSTNVLKTTKMSTQPNTDKKYVEVGIVHYTNTQGINVLRQVGTELMTLFGGKGFDTSVYDYLRDESVKHVNDMLNDNQKVCNMRMEFSHAHPDLIVHHIYGTLLEKI